MVRSVYDLEEKELGILLFNSCKGLESVGTGNGIKRFIKYIQDEVVRVQGKPSDRFVSRFEKEIIFMAENIVRMVQLGYSSFSSPITTISKIGVSPARLKELIAMLRGTGSMGVIKGGFVSLGGKINHVPTIFTPSRFLTSEAGRLSSGKIFTVENEGLVEVRDRVSKKHVGFEKRDFLKETAIMSRFASFNVSAKMMFLDEVVPTQIYKLVYIDDKTKGGRIYNSSGGVQTLKKGLRSDITIDGEQVVEIDFSAMHPHILLQRMKGGSIKDVEDLLRNFEVANGVPFNPYLEGLYHKIAGNVADKYVRNLVKIVLLIGINASSRREAVASIKRKIEENENDFVGIDGRDVVKYVDRILDLMPKIFRENLFTDRGVYLQNIDGQIMLDIVDQSIKKGIHLVPLHDGVLCKASEAENMVAIFENAWYNMFSDTQFCKVSVK